MKRLRASSAFVAVLLMLSSCAADAEPTETSAITESVSDESGEDEYYHADYLPERDYDGYVFRVVTVPEWPTDITEENGDVVNDAYYERNRIIEERYNIEFEESQVPNYTDLTDTFRKSALAVSDDFDLCRLIMRDAFSLAVEGYVAPVSALPYVDPTQDWYVKHVNDELLIDGVLPFAYSDECIQIFEGAICVFFNKNMIADFGLVSPYELVEDGSWTMEKYFEYASSVIADLNNDGQYDIFNDRAGIIDELDYVVPNFWVGAGVKTVEKVDGIPYFISGNEKLYDILEYLSDMLKVDGIIFRDFDAFGTAESSRPQARRYFATDASLFTMAGFGVSKELRDMQSDFGIVPIPKYDEAQDRYYTRIDDGWLNVPLACATDLERTSIIMEALAVESKNLVIPAIYEDSIKNKCIRDEESLEMLELIMENRVIDLGDTVWYDAVRQVYMGCFYSGSDAFVSAEASNLTKIENTIAEMTEMLKENG